jgi:hypothetical protein
MLSINVFQGASERATSSQDRSLAHNIDSNNVRLDSIIAQARLVADFIDSIGHERKSETASLMSALPSRTDILWRAGHVRFVPITEILPILTLINCERLSLSLFQGIDPAAGATGFASPLVNAPHARDIGFA